MSAYFVFGDSISKGVLYDPAHNHYQVGESFFERFRKIKGIDLKLQAQFGATIRKGRQLIERSLTAIGPEDTVILEFGGNDCNFDWKAIAEDPLADHLANTPLDQFTEIYQDLVDRVLSRTERVILCTLPPLDSEKFFAFVSAGLRADRLLRFLGEVQNIGRWQEAYSLKVQQIAALKHLPVLPLRAAFSQEALPELVCADGMHPNEKGQEQLLSALLSWDLQPLTGA